ncbi:hypothetical protein HY256_00995, partial [Candidatus Sumerlaeota bacterium]|nr:hypothetical protein [Candidatus Sumerlaeota bacterium]
MKVQFKKQITLLALALALTAAGSCTRVYPVRTLPSWVRGIYIPMVMNKTTEPGIEEIATRQVQEEFMADGRVNVVPKSQADLQLVAVIKSFRTQVDSYDNDRIARRKEVLITSELKLYDPEVDPFKPDQEPIANLGTILTRYRYSGDLRSVNVLTEDERNDD